MNLSIKNKLSLTFAGIILLIAAVQTWLTSERLTDEANRSTQQLASSLTQSNISTISQWLESKTKIVQASINGFNKQAEPTASLAQAISSGDFDLVYAGTQRGEMLTGKAVTFPGWL